MLFDVFLAHTGLPQCFEFGSLYVAPAPALDPDSMWIPINYVFQAVPQVVLAYERIQFQVLRPKTKCHLI